MNALRMRTLPRPPPSLFLLAALFLLPFNRSFGQSQTTGRIVGTIVDPDGAAVAGAEVVAVHKATGIEQKATTDETGTYSVYSLQSGEYRVSVTKSLFVALSIETVVVVITETSTVSTRKLVLEGVNAAAVVVSSVPVLQVDGPQMGRFVDSIAVAELPQATRNPTQLLGLSTGASVALPDNAALGSNSQDPTVDGARTTQNAAHVNGIDANYILTNSFTNIAVPAPETVMEFKLQTSNYDSGYGRAGGGNIQIVTRSGSNDLRGTVYGYFRDSAHGANSPFLKAAGVERPPLERNVFGGTIGGPIRMARSFFFGSYQGTREQNGASSSSLSSNVLIAPGLTDDRSEQNLLAVFTPKRSNGTFATSIHPVALALLNVRRPDGSYLIPTPQADGHYSGSALSSYREDQFNANLDYHPNEKDRFAIKFFFSNAPQTKALDGANVPGFGRDEKQNNRLISLQGSHVFNQNTIIEARAGYNFIRADRYAQSPVKDSDLGIQRANADAYPGLGLNRIGPAGALVVGSANGSDQRTSASSTTLATTVWLVRGRHSIRTGAEVILNRSTLSTNNNRRGSINFQTFNNFLVGTANSSVFGSGLLARNLSTNDYSSFFQDNWRISTNLTLNLGLRYELDLPPEDSLGRIGVFDPTLYKPRMEMDGSGIPVGPPISGLVQAGNVIPIYDLPNVPNVGKRVLRSNDPNNFAPRLGFAYSVPAGRLAVRGGYGIYYSRVSMNFIGLTLNVPPMYVTRRSPVGSTVPYESPYVPLPQEDQFPTIVQGINLAGNAFDRNMRTPYIQQFNTSVQHALRENLLLEVAYVGTRGVNLLRQVPINQARLASPEHPILNDVTGAVITTNTAMNLALRAPYQGVDVGGNFFQNQSTAQSTYHSLQTSMTKRSSKGLQFLASYTYSKSIDNGSGTDGVDTAPVIGNALDNRANRGLSNFDAPHRFVLSYVWVLPRPAFVASSAAGTLLFSNWQLAGVTTVMSGLPIDVVDSLAGSFYGLNVGTLARPSWAPGATRKTATSNIPAGYFFNPSAFVRPRVGVNQPIP
ncbi:MAG TPA: carboxypeptidase regulatory-like domain-containing protein, partial [Terriglobia bacterium]|nr:carboxypeptidase regulatory-like domain-containing protein [Terriglobia bacterium]